MNGRQHPRLAAHLLRIVAYVAVAFWLAFAYAGWVLASGPETAKHSHLIGWAILFVCAAVMIATMDHWVKYLPLIFGGLTLGALLATASGHLLNESQPFPRSIAAAVMALSVGCGLISRTFAHRELSIFDRVGLLCLLAAVLGGLFEGSPEAGIIGLGTGTACLLAAWAHHHLADPETRTRVRKRARP